MLAVTGYILSPLSWWNDLVVNIPLAYVMSWPFSQLNENLFLPAFIVAYWLTNISGLWLLFFAARDLQHKPVTRKTLRYSILASVLYTLLIVALVYAGWIESPTLIFAAYHHCTGFGSVKVSIADHRFIDRATSFIIHADTSLNFRQPTMTDRDKPAKPSSSSQVDTFLRKVAMTPAADSGRNKVVSA